MTIKVLVIVNHSKEKTDNDVVTRALIKAGLFFTDQLENIKIISVESENIAENIAHSLLPHILEEKFSHVLAPSDTFSKNVLPRLCAMLDVGMISDVVNICDTEKFIRHIYAGNILTTVKSLDKIKVMTIRASAFQYDKNQQDAIFIKKSDIQHVFDKTRFVGIQKTQNTRPDLSSADIVVSGGRGLQNAENFHLIEQLADVLNAAVGASRAAVDAGWITNDYQVGQTGKIVAPKLYIAVGISGAIQHAAGIKDSGCIIAINKDPEAPIFQIADFGLVGDLFEILPELIQKLKTRMG